MEISEEELERRLLFSHWGGQAAALEQAAAYTLQRAGDAFSNNNDKQAEFLREQGRWLNERAVQARSKQREFSG